MSSFDDAQQILIKVAECKGTPWEDLPDNKKDLSPKTIYMLGQSTAILAAVQLIRQGIAAPAEPVVESTSQRLIAKGFAEVPTPNEYHDRPLREPVAAQDRCEYVTAGLRCRLQKNHDGHHQGNFDPEAAQDEETPRTDRLAFEAGEVDAEPVVASCVVPLEPTTEMLEAAQELDTEGEDDPMEAWRAAYQAMIAAAPKEPVAESVAPAADQAEVLKIGMDLLIAIGERDQQTRLKWVAHLRAEVAERKVAELRNVGAQMANLCYNCDQMDRIPQEVRETMDDLRKQWDAFVCS